MIIYNYVNRAELKPNHIMLSLKQDCDDRWGMINLEVRKEAPGVCLQILQPQVHCSGRLQEGRAQCSLHLTREERRRYSFTC